MSIFTETPIDLLRLSVRTTNALVKANITTVSELIELRVKRGKLSDYVAGLGVVGDEEIDLALKQL